MDTTLLAGITQGAASILAAFGAVFLALLLVRRHELSKARVDCVRRIFAYRFALNGQASADDESMIQYLAALNEIPFLFAPYPFVIATYRDALANAHSPDSLAKILRALSRHVAVDFQTLSDDDIKSFFSAPRRRKDVEYRTNVP